MDERFIRLVNPYYLLESTFVPDPLMTMAARKSASDGSNANGGVRKCSTVKMELQKDCGEALVRLFDEAERQGMVLYLKSPYRSYQTQKTQYYNRLKNNNGKDDGWVAKPGASDHQTGLGCDVLNYEWRNRSMNSTFIQTAEAQWMEKHCAEFGFVIRYPSGKEDITGINYEPWHLRYVGEAVAKYIMGNGLCLEEFHDQLQAAIQDYLLRGGSLKRVERLFQARTN